MPDEIKLKVTDLNLQAAKIGAIGEAKIQGALESLAGLSKSEFQEVLRRIPGINGGLNPELINRHWFLQRYILDGRLVPKPPTPPAGIPVPHLHLADNVYALDKKELTALDSAFVKEFNVSLKEAASIQF